MAVKKPDLINGDAQSRVVKKTATESKNPVIREYLGETAKERKEKQAQITGTIQERLDKMKNSGPAISSNVREFQDTRTEEEKRAVNQAARDRAAGKVMTSLENQRRQAQVDMDIDTMNALDARMKAIRASMGQQTIGDRASDALSTAVSSTVSSGVNCAGLMIESLRNLNTAALEQKEKVKVAQDNIARYTEMMKTATGAEKEQLQKWIASNQRTINAAQSTLDTWNKPTDPLVQSIYQNDDLKADQKRKQLSALGYNGSALYKALGQKLG